MYAIIALETVNLEDDEIQTRVVWREEFIDERQMLNLARLIRKIASDEVRITEDIPPWCDGGISIYI